MTVYGDGKQTRSFQFVSDLVSLLNSVVVGAWIDALLPFHLILLLLLPSWLVNILFCMRIAHLKGKMTSALGVVLL
jgi:hypothetical protein